MRYTLLQHFQGVFLGGWIGQVLINDHPGGVAWQFLAQVLVDSFWQNPSHINWLEIWEKVDLSQVDLSQGSVNNLTDTPPANVNNIVLNTIDQAGINQRKNFFNFSQMIGGFLPIVLFYHENPQQLQRELTKAHDSVWQNQPINDLNPTEQDISGRRILINNLAILIARLLQEKYDLSNSINHQAILHPLFNQLSPKDPFYHQLLLLQNLLIAGEGLYRVIAILQANGKNLAKEMGFDSQFYEPVLLAIYCFLDTPTNSKIAMQRAIKCPGKAEVVPLLGILLGAYHSYPMLLTQWQMINNLTNLIDHPSNIKTIELFRHKISSSKINQINLMAEKLWLAWSGFYLPHNNNTYNNVHNNAFVSTYNNNNIAIASCNIMRPRPSR